MVLAASVASPSCHDCRSEIPMVEGRLKSCSTEMGGLGGTGNKYDAGRCGISDGTLGNASGEVGMDSFLPVFLGDLVMFPLCSVSSDSSKLYDAANKLYTAMWRQDLTNRLRDVDKCEGFKYLPATVVSDLGLRELRFNATVMLVREEYRSTFDILEGRQNNSGGMVVTSHPGTGTNLLQKDNFAHVLITSR